VGVIAAYRRVLTNGPLARLLFGEFVSSIGDWLYLVALLVVIWDQSNDPVVLGIVGAARILPYVILSVPAGIVADRMDRRLILLTTDIIRGVIMLMIAAAVAFDAPVIVVVVLAVIATCFSAFFSPAIGSYLPSLVRDESELGPANSAWSSLDNVAFFIGPAFAALLLGLGSLPLAFVLNAVTFAIVAVVLLRLPSRRSLESAGAEKNADSSATPEPKVGLRTALRPIARPLAGLTVINIANGFVFGGLGVITVVLAVDVFKVGEAGTGVLNSAIGVGGVIGAVVAGALVLRRRLGPPLIAGAMILAAGLVVLGQVDAFSVALVAMALAAGGALLVEIVGTTLLQRIVPDEIRGRTLGVLETTYVAAYSLGSFVLPIFGATQPGLTLLASAVLIAVASVVAVLLIGRFAVQTATFAPAIRRFEQVSMFAGLPPARLETAMRAAQVVDAKQGDVIIRQGNDADLFYVIDDGRVEVTQARVPTDKPLVLREMGAGEFFGEIGLLTGVPRTATVTAQTNVRMAALAKKDFLELVEAGPGLTYRLLDIHRGGMQPAEG
jgi:MFS family permease